MPVTMSLLLASLENMIMGIEQLGGEVQLTINWL